MTVALPTIVRLSLLSPKEGFCITQPANHVSLGKDTCAIHISFLRDHFCLGKRPSLLHSRNTSFLMERNCCAQPNHFFPWEESSCSTQLFLFFFFFVLLMVTFALPVLITSLSEKRWLHLPSC